MILQLEDYRTYYKRIRRWHGWFAWYPVWVEPNRFSWLERVERKVTCTHSYAGANCCWAYRKVSK